MSGRGRAGTGGSSAPVLLQGRHAHLEAVGRVAQPKIYILQLRNAAVRPRLGKRERPDLLVLVMIIKDELFDVVLGFAAVGRRVIERGLQLGLEGAFFLELIDLLGLAEAGR